MCSDIGTSFIYINCSWLQSCILLHLPSFSLDWFLQIPSFSLDWFYKNLGSAQILFVIGMALAMLVNARSQGRTQEFFRGGQDLQYSRENASEGAKRPSGGGSRRGDREGDVLPPRRRSFCIFLIEIERSGAHFGWIFGGKLSVKQSKKKIHIHGKCILFLRLW